MGRTSEYFKHENVIKFSDSINLEIRKLYKQERDWTCSLACIRTLLSSRGKKVYAEDYYIDKYKMKPGPYFSKDIKKIGMLKDFDVKYGCDDKNATFDTVLNLMRDGYAVMLESMYNYSHWMVLLGYYRLGKNIENNLIACFEPYYNNIRLINVDEFIGMWVDGNYKKSNVEKDFIAIK